MVRFFTITTNSISVSSNEAYGAVVFKNLDFRFFSGSTDTLMPDAAANGNNIDVF
jgi:hypothetical protein